jgi:hypothetical protein
VTNRIIGRRAGLGLAAAAAVALGFFAFFKPAEQSAPAVGGVATLVRLDPGGEAVATEAVAAGSSVSIDRGFVRLLFSNGAIVAVEAPASLTIVSGMEVSLSRGSLNAWCPESAHGFRVTTEAAALTDLGTSFGVKVGQDGKAEFMVLDGLAEVEKDGAKVRLGGGEAVQAQPAGPLEAVVFDPSVFKNTWPLSYGILATRGAVVPVDPDVPEKLVGVEYDERVLVIPERREVAFSRAIGVQMDRPGTIPGDFDGQKLTLEPRDDIRLSSFLIRYNPVGTRTEEFFVRFEGEVTFDRPVLGIAARREQLEDTDGLFATGDWSAVYRGIELVQTANPSDRVTLSEDRRTVKVVFYAGASTDEVRVILEDR